MGAICARSSNLEDTKTVLEIQRNFFQIFYPLNIFPKTCYLSIHYLHVRCKNPRDRVINMSTINDQIQLDWTHFWTKDECYLHEHLQKQLYTKYRDTARIFRNWKVYVRTSDYTVTCWVDTIIKKFCRHLVCRLFGSPNDKPVHCDPMAV